MESLKILFGGQDRVKNIRLFLFNPGEIFDVETICEKLKIKIKQVKEDLIILDKAKLIRKKAFFKSIEVKKGKKIIHKKKKIIGYLLNPEFSYTSQLKELFVSDEMLKRNTIVQKLSRAGKIKMVIIAGIFIQNPESRLDMLVVGDRINRTILDNSIKALEVELGKELNYAYFELSDFQYRLEMCDKLIRDVFDFPHQVLLDKINL